MAPIDKGIVLHVGLLKTGSTTLQQALFPKHSQLIYMGRYFDNSVTKGMLSEEMYDALSPALWKLNKVFDAAEASRVCQEHFCLDVPDGKFLLGSWEGLGDHPTIVYRRMLSRVQEVFGRCRIMYVLRNPFKQVPSEYLEKTSGKFFNPQREWIKPLLDIHAWFERKSYKGEKAQEPLNYNQNIQISVDLLGKDNVGIFLFEDLVEDPESYYRAISSFIGIDADETYALTQQKHFNPRLSQGQLDLIWKLDSSALTRSVFSRLTPRWRRFLLRKMAKSNGPAEVELTPELHEKIVNSTRDGHRWLVENFDLPLEKYGYPL